MTQPVPTTNQTGNTVTDGDIVAGDKNIYGVIKKTKLSNLFEKLKDHFESGNAVTQISDDLSRFSRGRDTIGLEQKLMNGSREDLLDDAVWLKQEYFKKLTKFQFYEPAQEIHACLLAIVLEKFRNIIYPMLRNQGTDADISRAISYEIIDPVMKTIHEEGCNDIMGLSSTDVEGMIFFLTGLCHINWNKNDRIPSSI